jgi:hypothetical protein
MLHADELLYSGRHREVILASFCRRGIEPQDFCDWQRMTTSEVDVAVREEELSGAD